MELSIEWWNNLDDKWKEIFNKATDKWATKGDPLYVKLLRIPNIKELDCSHNQIADLSPLQNLTKLVYLDCSHNQIADLSPLQNLTKLRELSCQRNQIADLSPLKNLTKLIYLNYGYNQISDEQIRLFREDHLRCEIWS